MSLGKNTFYLPFLPTPPGYCRGWVITPPFFRRGLFPTHLPMEGL
jgi:hypothetical protein